MKGWTLTTWWFGAFMIVCALVGTIVDESATVLGVDVATWRLAGATSVALVVAGAALIIVALALAHLTSDHANDVHSDDP